MIVRRVEARQHRAPAQIGLRKAGTHARGNSFLRSHRHNASIAHTQRIEGPALRIHADHSPVEKKPVRAKRNACQQEDGKPGRKKTGSAHRGSMNDRARPGERRMAKVVCSCEKLPSF